MMHDLFPDNEDTIESAVGDSSEKLNLGPRDEDGIRSLAAKENLIAVFAKQDELLLDIDHQMPMPNFDNLLTALTNNGVLVSGQCETISKSGKGRHIYIRLAEPLDAYARSSLQGALGSDPVRECMNVLRIVNGCKPKYAICLFETKNESYKVLGWRASMDGGSTVEEL